MPAGTELVSPVAMVFVGLAVAGALCAVMLRNILHAIFGLALALFGIAGLFLLLGSPFVAAMEVLIYIGGISVAMVFAVMLSTALAAARQKRSYARVLLALLPPLALFCAVGLALLKTTFASAPAGRDGSVAAIGRALLGHYNLVFEALSVVLLLAIVGAVAIARRDAAPTADEAAPKQTTSPP